jgi:UDP-N-acetylglucosamine transferase subunit ALG13
VGEGGARPEGFETVETLPFDDVKALLKDASVVVCHGGTGSLITALREGCHVIAMPRLFSLGEVYDDHQVEITDAFVARGLVQVANNAEELEQALAATKTRTRTMATTEPTALSAYLDSVVAKLQFRQATEGRAPARAAASSAGP